MVKKIFFLTIIGVLLIESHAFGALSTVRYKMSGDLSALIGIRADAHRNKRPLTRENRKIIFYTQNPDSASKYITSHGGDILRKNKDLIVAKIPLDNVEDIIDNGPGIKYARLPRKFFPCEIISEGVNLSGAGNMQDSGITGNGVKIAVLDVGFKGLSAAIANGEIPPTVASHDFSDMGMETQYVHGTASAEIIHDIAPAAELHLLKMSDETDLSEAATYCKNNGIRIASISLGTFGTGPGNGTGTVDEICDDLKANGILVVAAAGNSGNTHAGDGTPIGTHWQGPFLDSGYEYPAGSGNRIHQFIPGDPTSYYNVIYAIPSHDDDGNPESDEVTIAMRWNDWPGANVDYDMYLLDGTDGHLIDSSTGIQSGTQQPLETIIIDVPDSAPYKVYTLLVTRKNDEPSGKDLELMLGGKCLFLPLVTGSPPIATSSSSLYEPADAQSVLTVGAIKYSSWTTGPQEEYSSQGPTNAWAGSGARIKPDICGPDAVSTYTYGAISFPGTSAATPHIAGAAALILSMHPQYTVDQLIAAIESNGIDMGSSGKDSIYGSGRLNIAASLNSEPILEWTGEAGYVSDGLEPELANGLTPLSFRIKYKDADGDAPVIHDICIDRNGDGDYSDPAEVVSMTAVSGANYVTGMIYSCETTIAYSGGSSNHSYYFRFADTGATATGNIASAISPQTAINKPDILQTLSLSIDITSWQLSAVPPGSIYLMDNSNKIKTTNNGDGPETYSLRITGEGNGWSAATGRDGADINKYVLSALFSASSETSIDSSYFNETASEDVISVDSATKASQTIFGSTRFPVSGSAVPVGANRNLWLELKAPTKDTTRIGQSINVTINAETQ
ncbi:MAG: S8 family serine peptidase [Candidatus Omnitrophota bacterium]|nr:S8 family serine peptidase [Candidatus Omnitrophota bacterium]